MDIRKPRYEELETIAHFVYEHNRSPKTSSLFCFQDEAKILAELQSLHNASHPVLVGFEEHKLYAVIFGFHIPETSRIDVSGPYSDEEADDQVGNAMLQAMCDLCAGCDLYFYIEDANQKTARLLHQVHASQEVGEYMMSITRDQASTCTLSPNIQLMEASDHHSFIQLMDNVFQDIYADGKTVINDPTREVYLYQADNQIQGFAVLKKLTGSNHATMEMIGIHQSWRGHGLGRKLLSHVLHILFEDPQITRVSLIVDQDNMVAIKLYQSFGFEITKTNCAYILSAKKTT